MAVKVLTTRRFKKDKVDEGYRLLAQMRSVGTLRAGYVTGHTLISVEEPNKLMVISTWTDIRGWQAWQSSEQRQAFAEKIAQLLESPEHVEIYTVGQKESEGADLA
jgi:quinol monooxygenase YgiN